MTKLSQAQANHILIWAGWVFLLGSLIGAVVCTWLWWTNQISDRAMLGLTLILSLLAITGQAAGILLTALTKRDVDC